MVSSIAAIHRSPKVRLSAISSSGLHSSVMVPSSVSGALAGAEVLVGIDLVGIHLIYQLLRVDDYALATQIDEFSKSMTFRLILDCEMTSERNRKSLSVC